jgi:long-chain fatty acid transport protein
MKTIGLNPVVTYSPSKRFSFGGGLVAQKMDVEFKSKAPVPGNPDANVELTGDSIGYGFNLGALFWATDSIKLGAAYRSKVAHDVSGDLKITGTPLGLGDVSENAEADLELPANLYLGAAYLWDKLTLEFDLQWTQWSSWDKLEATFVTQPKLSEPKNWKDSWTYRLGANYSLTPAWDLRAGLVFDPTPIPDDTLDPGVPAGDRWFYSIGCGYKVGKIILDLNYSYMAGGSRTFDNNVGNYGPAGNVTGEFQNLNSHNLLLNFTYLFGPSK